MFLNFNMSDACRFFPTFPSKILLFYTCLIYQAHGFLRLYEEDAGNSTPYLRPLKPTPTPTNKCFDELLDAFITVETHRKSVLKEAQNEGTKLKNNETIVFLEVLREADEALVNVRHYFDAGRILFDFRNGKSNLKPADAAQKTEILRDEKFLGTQMLKLATIYKILESKMGELPREALSTFRPLLDTLKHSDEALTPLAKQFEIDLEETKKKMSK
nr:PREDICTED: uncharacterized protein LOC109040374 isoform X2 [Bemisia tabaci]XP_018911848.1 PREDICTED: uncharacterized protein LOC109040374 isoform X2 [Bemisia tabaci]